MGSLAGQDSRVSSLFRSELHRPFRWGFESPHRRSAVGSSQFHGTPWISHQPHLGFSQATMEFIIEKELATLNLSQLFNLSQLLTHHPASFNTAIWFSSYLGRWLLIPLRHGKPACGSLPPQRLSVRGHESWFLHHPKREHPSVHTLKGFLRWVSENE